MNRMFLLLSFVGLCWGAALPPPPALAPHPRLILTPSRQAELRAAIASGGDAAAFAALLKAHADWALTQPPVPRGTAGASGVLIAVRNSLDLLLTCAAQAVLGGAVAHGDAHFERAVLEANNLALTWSDWNTQQHALDTGEALLATGLAYDWLYPGLTPAERAALLAGIVKQGLQPYRKFIGTSTFWWMNNTINWNCVCAAGGVVAVLALQGDAGAPEWAWGGIAAPLVAGVPPCIGAYHSDSSWEEGPAYWSYASKLNAWHLSALQSVFNSTLGLAELPGVAHAARFPAYASGAQAITAPAESATYNWADAEEGYVWSPFAQWWSLHFQERGAGYFSRQGTLSVGPSALQRFAWGGFAEALLFFDPLGAPSDIDALPRAASFSYINMGVFRGPWFAAKARQTYAAFKGGNSAWNHNHLDLGSFVFDTNGTRFACDMGADNYALPGYFDNAVRWKYYRLNSHGHNVVLFDNATQPAARASSLLFFNATGDAPVDAAAALDLSAAYSPTASQATRTFTSYNDTRALLLVDAFVYGASAAPRNLTWQMHTRAAARVLSAHAVALTARDGSTALLAFVPALSSCPSFAGFAVTDLGPLLPPPFDSAQGYSRVDGLALAPAQAGAQCVRMAFALGDAEVVQELVR